MKYLGMCGVILVFYLTSRPTSVKSTSIECSIEEEQPMQLKNENNENILRDLDGEVFWIKKVPESTNHTGERLYPPSKALTRTKFIFKENYSILTTYSYGYDPGKEVYFYKYEFSVDDTYAIFEARSQYKTAKIIQTENNTVHYGNLKTLAIPSDYKKHMLEIKFALTSIVAKHQTVFVYCDNSWSWTQMTDELKNKGNIKENSRKMIHSISGIGANQFPFEINYNHYIDE